MKKLTPAIAMVIPFKQHLNIHVLCMFFNFNYCSQIYSAVCEPDLK
ncbi:protein of unknown function [Shewanella benthica]|uniref:Uncharacterized protein n=1 Tax=Shewanella benthica TaxID=43661 RepID=A0A330M4A7_9GAMM|nr:protein of unknown function [Shewanella benthica]